MKAKRLLCFALCLAMLVAMFAGCNVVDSGDEVEETTASKKPVVTKPVTTTVETEAITEEGSGEDATGGEDVTGGEENNTTPDTPDVPLDPIPVEEKNYGEAFNFLILNDIFKFEYFYAAEQSAEVMANAVYTRQEEVKAQIGIEITAKKHEIFTEYKTDFETSVKSEDGLYQACLTHVNVDVAPMVTGGLLYDFSEFESVNLDKSYWNKSLMDSLAYNGDYYLAYGDYLLATTYVVSFNKTLLNKYCAQDLGETTLYDLVNNYQWTFDKMLDLASKAHNDKNGDGKKDTTDSYGISGYMWVPCCSFLHANGLNLTRYDSTTGKYVEDLSANGKKIEAIATKVKEMYNAEYSFFWDTSIAGDPSKMVTLKENNTLFYLAGTNELTKFVETDIEFGILPYPMWDEAQQEYRSLSWNGYMVVPYNIGTVYGSKMAGDTLELLGYFSAPVTTAFYEKLLGAQVSESPDDADMLKIVWQSQVSDFGMAYSTFGNKSLDVMLYGIPRIVLSIEGVESFTRLWAKYQKQVKSDLQKMQK